MPISSLIIRTRLEMTENVVDVLKDYKETSICEKHGENILLITETESQTKDKEFWAMIEKIPGVLQCDLIYHNFEDEEGFSYDK